MLVIFACYIVVFEGGVQGCSWDLAGFWMTDGAMKMVDMLWVGQWQCGSGTVCMCGCVLQ